VVREEERTFMPEQRDLIAQRMDALLSTHDAARTTHHVLGCLAALLVLAAPAAGQQRHLRVKVENVEVGFPSQAPDRDGTLYKSGLWTPVLVTLSGGEGDIRLPALADGTCHASLLVEGTDSDGGPNVYTTPFVLGEKERLTVVGYTMPGSSAPDLVLSLVPNEQPDRPIKVAADIPPALPLNQHLYLALGARLPDLQAALLDLAGKEAQDTGPRVAGFETDAARLPDHWFGYDAVDLLILTTDNDRFLGELERRPAQVKALAQWVRRGGRLLISVSLHNQDRVRKLLGGWQQPLPPVLAADAPPHKSLASVQSWANVLDKPFPMPAKGLAVPRLKAVQGIEILIKDDSGQPLLARLPYGLGSVSVVALDLSKAPFTTWKGRVDFWRVLVNRLAPRVLAGASLPEGARFGREEAADVATQLHRELDNFDVPVISFGWVAVFILLYILIVGPLDYLILKKVFKRLEWTWITFPAIVLLVSAIAYFTAYALKGNQLKVNKLDLVDLDLRSDLDAAGKTRKAYAYGTSWFAILSPQIKSYTVGVAPALSAWAEGRAAGPGQAMVTWLGRPEAVGQGGFGRPRSQTLFSRTYRYAPDAAGLRDVPIPVWTTKAFAATWGAPLARLPFAADLHYRPGDVDQQLAGTIQNNLPVSLEDVFLFYGDKAYPVDGPLQGGKEARPHQMVLDPGRRDDPDRWARRALGRSVDDFEQRSGRGPFQPLPILKELLFQELVGGNNHSFRRLDQSWRLRPLDQRDDGVREAILVGRLARAEGLAQQLTAATDPRLPAHFWLGALPGDGLPLELPGTLVQDTYIRVFLPVRPQ
jgi:hypothetical protein